MNIPNFLVPVLAILFIAAITNPDDHNHAEKTSLTIPDMHIQPSDSTDSYEIERTEEEWKELLSWGEYRILRKGGTETPYANEYWDNKKEGIYYCRGCGQPLYSSETKYRSGTGWPSFWEPIRDDVIEEKEDNSLWMERTETVCSRCGSHLGHVFDDGPDPTGLRYCMNSQALLFKEMDLDKTKVKELEPIEVD